MRGLVVVCACVGLVACGADDDAGSGDTNSETSGDGDGDPSSELGELLLASPTLIHHPGQPMVIDAIVELDAPGTGELVHTSDDDVRVALLEPGPGESATTLRFRVRGLLPDASHPLALSVTETGGERTGAWSGSVTTDAALPGFVAKFEIESLGADAVEPIWRLFDMTQLFSDAPSGVFLVDDEGTTRWYLGDADDYIDLDDIYTGLNLRGDGSISFMRRDAGLILDEFGQELMRVEAETIGASAGFHHDLVELPSGNFLVLSYSFRDVLYEGEGTLHVAGDTILEFTPAGQLVWTWDSFDHLDPQRRRDGFDIPMQIPDPDSDEDGHDWTHGNGLVYAAADDTILLSMRHQDWILAIDHQSGEIQWRLGDEGDFTLLGAPRWFFHQHSPQWQPDGSLLLYDNAVGNPAQPNTDAHSRAVRYVLDLDDLSATQVWADDDPVFRSAVAGDADRSPGGHVLRLDSTWVDDQNPTPGSRIRELDPEATPNAVWTLFMPPGKFGYRALPVSRFVGESG